VSVELHVGRADNDGMASDESLDYYEVLQVSPGAEPDTIHRIYRLLAQRFHPDNRETGDAERFRVINEAYQEIGDAVRRARYDVLYHQRQRDRVRIVSAGATAEEDFELEQNNRLTVLEALQSKRRLEPNTSGMPVPELEQLTGRPREHLEFTIWYLVQKKFAQRDDSARLLITAEGVDFLEEYYRSNVSRSLAATNQS
jgi:curved DNA-binding protein CbpA